MKKCLFAIKYVKKVYFAAYIFTQNSTHFLLEKKKTFYERVRFIFNIRGDENIFP